MPRLFNMSNPVADRDLGAPNNRCTPPGPCVGEGGEPGKTGENCDPLGLVLIIQEDNDDPSIPDDQRGRGKITFDFKEPAEYLYEIGLLDIDKPDNTITVVKANGKETIILIPEYDKNSKQTLPINIADVKQWIVNIEDSCAITYIRFCEGASTLPTLPPTEDCVRVVVDFLTTADGTPIPGGAYVEKEWAEFGLMMSSTGGLGSVPRVLNTSEVGNGESGYGDHDLDSPNEMCTPAGPG